MGRRVKTLAVLVVLLALTAACLFVVVERTLPAGRASLRLTGLHAEVDVDFDRFGIPYIRASTDQDAAEALGFVHARDRMMQMDLMRRAAAGELSELIGPVGLKLDESARVLGTKAAAENSLASLSPRTRALLVAYSRGVNAFIARRGRFAAPEYLALGTPRDWTPVDSLLWAETMGLALSDNLSVELERLDLSRRLSRDVILSLWPTSEPALADQASVEPPMVDRMLARATLRALPKFPGPFTLPDSASNEWAVDGRHTTTGSPLLAGDPHLSYGLPCLWYLARIDTPTGSMVGATAPGTPFVVLGHNRVIAWTFTTTGADTEDLFVERLVDPSHYASPSGPLAFTHRRERIRVRGHPDLVLDVRATRHGPVISDLPRLFGIKTPRSDDVIAAQIASLSPGNTAAGGLDELDHATDLGEAEHAAEALTAPVQNLLVADRHAIGLFTTGRVPIRRSGDGSMPTDGSDGLHDWIGFASGHHLPQVVAPASGVLVNANEPVLGSSSTIAMGRDRFGDWRSRRIRQLLDRPDHRFDVADFASMQGDMTSAYVERLLPILQTAKPMSSLAAAALRLLEHWDCTMSSDQPQPLIVDAWLAAVGDALGRATHDDNREAMAPLTYVFQALNEQAPGCDGSCVPLLTQTLEAAVASLGERYGDDPSKWRWGVAHHATFSNPLWSTIPVLGLFSTMSRPVGGDGSTVDAQGFASDTPPFTAVHGASYRAVYDLSDLDRSRFVIATGQSGNPFSAHLLDFSGRWFRLGTVMIRSRPDRASSHLSLEPDDR